MQHLDYWNTYLPHTRPTLSAMLLGTSLATGVLETAAAAAQAVQPVAVRSEQDDDAPQQLSIRVTPRVTHEPGSIRVQILIERDDRHRSFTVLADGTSYFRSSTLPLEGAAAARSFMLVFEDLPGGDYAIRVELNGVDGVLESVERDVQVAESPPEAWSRLSCDTCDSPN